MDQAKLLVVSNREGDSTDGAPRFDRERFCRNFNGKRDTEVKMHQELTHFKRFPSETSPYGIGSSMSAICTSVRHECSRAIVGHWSAERNYILSGIR